MTTLLRRAPREVYRVYGEEEFLADAPYEGRVGATSPVAGERQLQGLAAATMLLAAVGAVGGLIVLTCVPSIAGGRRRGGTRMSAATGSPAPARPGVRREQAASNVPGRRIAGRRPPKLTHRAPHAGARPRVLAAARSRRGGTDEVTVAVSAAAPAQAAAPVSVADSTARASAVRPPQGQVEFGFER